MYIYVYVHTQKHSPPLSSSKEFATAHVVTPFLRLPGDAPRPGSGGRNGPAEPGLGPGCPEGAGAPSQVLGSLQRVPLKRIYGQHMTR